jgi:hypothetical protein
MRHDEGIAVAVRVLLSVRQASDVLMLHCALCVTLKQQRLKTVLRCTSALQS